MRERKTLQCHRPESTLACSDPRASRSPSIAAPRAPSRAVPRPVSRAARTTDSSRIRAPHARRRSPVSARRTGGSARPEVKFASRALVFGEDPRAPYEGFAPELRTDPAPSSPPDDLRGWVVLGISSVGLGPTSTRRGFRLGARARTGCLPPRTKVEEPEPFSSPPAGEPARGTPLVPAISRRP
jgi:hypothetical protein